METGWSEVASSVESPHFEKGESWVIKHVVQTGHRATENHMSHIPNPVLVCIFKYLSHCKGSAHFESVQM